MSAVVHGAQLRGGASAADVVEASDIRRSFGDHDVLRGVDLLIRPGEFVALLGRSGSGKSTLLRAVAGLDQEYTGHLEVRGQRAVVFQDPRLLPWKRIRDNVTLGLPKSARQQGLEVLADVGLERHADAWPLTLSGGEAQRAALARALVREPDVLLLDEPFGALDALTRIRMHGLLQELCRKYRPGVLLVTHDVDEAILLADRVLVLTDGIISFDARVEVPSPRLRADAAFIDLRRRLLAELGVDEADEGRHG